MDKGFYSFAMNYMGLPAGNVPANYNDGLPVGVQIVVDPVFGKERRLLSVRKSCSN